jgi:hypothetical protein
MIIQRGAAQLQWCLVSQKIPRHIAEHLLVLGKIKIHKATLKDGKTDDTLFY